MATNAERPKTGRIELHSWRDFTKVMKVMGAGKWIYRGHEDADWGLKSGLDRHVESLLGEPLSRKMKSCGKAIHKDWTRTDFVHNLPRAEFFAISRFRAMAQEYQTWDTNVDTLIAMQHYGAKTRLVDFTTAIMIALFFAYEKRTTGKARAVLDEVRSAVNDWPRFAAEAEVRDDFVGAISRQLGLE